MRVLRGHTKSVRCLAFSPDGRALASGGVDKNVRLWDPSSGEVRAVLKGPRTYVHTVAFSPDGQALACAGGDLLLYHLATGRSARSSKEDVRTVGDVSYAPDGQTIATASRLLGGANTVLAGYVQLWDAAGPVAALAAPGKRRLTLERQPERTVAVEKFLREGPVRDGYHVWSVAFSPDSRTLALGTDSGGALLWDLTSDAPPTRLATQAAVHGLAFTADGRLLAATEGLRVRVWDPATGKGVSTLRGHAKKITSLAFAPAGGAGRATLLTGSEDETVRFWDVTTGQERTAFRWPVGKVRAVAFAPDGMTAAAAGDQGDVVIWDLEAW